MARSRSLLVSSLAAAIHFVLFAPIVGAQDATAAAPAGAAAAQTQASVWIYVYGDQQTLGDVALTINGKPAGKTSAQGGVGTRLAAGDYVIGVEAPERAAAEFPLQVVSGEQVQVQVSFAGARAPQVVVRSATRGETTIDLAPAAGVAASEAAPQAATNDDVSPVATTLRGIEVVGTATALDDRAAYTDEKRASAQINEALSAEQISAAGDSDTAQALKRVTGLSLVDGKYVYVRGLGERYSSVLFNGAQIPSPDPTRRVVPLDLFPTEILEGIIVQKTYSVDMPGEFGGGALRLRTKSMPEEFFAKVTLGGGYADGTTFEDGLRYRGGSEDWTGYDDVRGAPDSLLDATRRFGRLRVQTPFSEGLTPTELQTIGQDLAAQGFDIGTDQLGPSTSLAGSIGNSFKFNDDWRAGFLGAVRWAQGWDDTTEVRRDFGIGSGDLLTKIGEFERHRTEREIDLSAFLNLGLELGPDHKITSTTTLLRQSIDTARIDEGFNEGPDDISRYYKLEWEENELLTAQLLGEHRFPGLSGLTVNWAYTDSSASRESPNTREYRYDRFGNAGSNDFRFSTRSDSNAITYGDLADDAQNYTIDLSLPLTLAEQPLTLLAGVNKVERDRDSQIRRYSYAGSPPPGSAADLRTRPLGQILVPGNIGPEGFVLTEVSRNSDAYSASQDLEAAYVSVDWQWEDKLRLIVGARREDNVQDVVTFNLINPTQIDGAAAIDQADVLPSVAATYFVNEESQLRAMYSQTLSRPDFRELSTSPFIDPLIDTISIGNPDLLQADIKNYDLRYEYYFSPTELASVALFRKTFANPIERVQTAGTGEIVTYFNVPDATLYGVEFDVYKYLDFFADDAEGGIPWEQFAVGLNYAWIKSDVSLTRETAGVATNLERPLQGQSPYVVNLQLGWQDPEGNAEATLLYNVAGRRISEVGAFGSPDVYEESFNQLDFTGSWRFSDSWKLKLRLRNLLDPKVEFMQGGEIAREYRRGREVLLTLEWTPQTGLAEAP